MLMVIIRKESITTLSTTTSLTNMSRTWSNAESTLCQIFLTLAILQTQDFMAYCENDF